MAPGSEAVVWLFVVVVLVVLLCVGIFRSIRVIPPEHAGIVERIGRYQRTLSSGLGVLIPVVDKLMPLVDLREQLMTFPRLAVVTKDNVAVSIDSEVYFYITDPQAAYYGSTSGFQTIEQLIATTLHGIVTDLNLDQALSSRDQMSAHLYGVMEGAMSGRGIRVSRVQVTSIDPPQFNSLSPGAHSPTGTTATTI